MKTNYEDLDSALNIESSIVEVEKNITTIDIVPTQPDDIKKIMNIQEQIYIH